MSLLAVKAEAVAGAPAHAARALALALGIGLAAMLFQAPDLTPQARAALICFGGAILAWTLTRLDPTFVALAAAIAMALTGAATQEQMMAALGAQVVWLLIGAFVIGAAFERSGLAVRFRDAALAGARTTESLFWRMSGILALLAFLIPSTSGRAALAMPAMRAFFDAPEQAGERRALALLIPVIILVTTSAALTGAGSHVLINDLLFEQTGETIGYLTWAAWGAPFALIAGAASCFAILRMLLSRTERGAAIAAALPGQKRWTAGEAKMLAILAATVALWTAGAQVGLGIAMIALVAAALLMTPRLGILSVDEGLAAVSWRLVIFVAAALAMGHALLESGAADWLIARAWGALGAGPDDEVGAVTATLAITVVAVASHLCVTSHVARAAILTPPILALAERAGLAPAAAAFLGSTGLNYCLTLPVCSKALLMFQGEAGLQTRDLVRLSAILAPVYLALMLAFAAFWWK